MQQTATPWKRPQIIVKHYRRFSLQAKKKRIFGFTKEIQHKFICSCRLFWSFVILPRLCLQGIRAILHAVRAFRKEKHLPTMNHWSDKRYFLTFSIRSDECPCISSAHMQTPGQTHTHSDATFIQKKHSFLCEPIWVYHAVDSSSSPLPVSIYPFLSLSAHHHNFHLFASELTCTWYFRNSVHFYCSEGSRKYSV